MPWATDKQEKERWIDYERIKENQSYRKRVLKVTDEI